MGGAEVAHDSPVWWLFAAVCTAIWLVVMCPAMPTRAYRRGVATGPVAIFVPVMLYGVKYGAVTAALPMYCAFVLAVPAGVLGHREALREALKDPKTSYGETSGPWTLQSSAALVAFMGLAVYYLAS